MDKIKRFLREIFAPKVTYWYQGKQVDANSKEAKRMKEGFEKIDEAFKKFDEAFNSFFH